MKRAFIFFGLIVAVCLIPLPSRYAAEMGAFTYDDFSDPTMYRSVKDFKPNMPVVDNSGYDHLVTDIADIHHYLNTDEKIHDLYRTLGDKKKMSRQFLRLIKTAVNIVGTHLVGRRAYLKQGVYRGQEPFIISEFGGAGYYKGAGNFMENFRHNVELMRQYPIITGYCLTQAYDVQNEKNGLLNFDRTEKYPAKDVRAINGMVGKKILTN